MPASNLNSRIHPLVFHISQQKHRQLIPDHLMIEDRPILGGLHQEYDLVSTIG